MNLAFFRLIFSNFVSCATVLFSKVLVLDVKLIGNFFKFRPLAYLKPCKTSMIELFFSLNNHQLMFYFCCGYVNPGRASSVATLELFGQTFVNNNNFDVREFSKALPKMMLFWMLFSKSHGNQFSRDVRSVVDSDVYLFGQLVQLFASRAHKSSINNKYKIISKHVNHKSKISQSYLRNNCALFFFCCQKISCKSLNGKFA